MNQPDKLIQTLESGGYRYFCDNCRRAFKTGCYTQEEFDNPDTFELWDEVCPRCGGYPTIPVEELTYES